MAITGKELAERYFQQAVELEKVKRAEQGKPQLSDVVKLYEEAIALNPAHTAAHNNLACLYAEYQSENPKEIDSSREIAKDHYQKAIKEGYAGSKHNFFLLQMVILSERAKKFESEGSFYERGLKNAGVRNPEKAIEMYQQAEDDYKQLILLLEQELARIASKSTNDKLVQYKEMLTHNKRLAKVAKENLQSMRSRNIAPTLHRAFCYEQGSGNNGTPQFNIVNAPAVVKRDEEPLQKRRRISAENSEENVAPQLNLSYSQNPAAFYSPSFLSNSISPQSMQRPIALTSLVSLLASELYRPSISAAQSNRNTR